MQESYPKAFKSPVIGIRELFDLLKQDPTARSLALSNLLTLVLAIVEDWPLKTLMYIYCWQNVIIGFFNCFRLLKFGEFIVAPRLRAPVPSWVKFFLPAFFAVHYGLFQFGYFQFIGRINRLDMSWVWLSIALFFGHHFFSFMKHSRREIEGKDIMSLMIFPYFRIVPMHLTIIFGGFVMMLFKGNFMVDRCVLAFFLLLKTDVDLKMHQVEHSGEKPSESQQKADPLPERME